jgi:hypothetical protein
VLKTMLRQDFATMFDTASGQSEAPNLQKQP